MKWRLWRRKTNQKPDRASLERKLEDIRDKRRSDPPMGDDEVPGVLGLALEQLVDATERSGRSRKAAVDRMRRTGLEVAATLPPPKLET